MTQFAYQLYGSRNFTPWSSVFTMLASAGYTSVEGFGPLYDNVEQTAADLKAAGLTMPSAHMSLEMLEQEPDTVKHLIKVLELQNVYCPYLDESMRPDSVDGYTKLGQRLEQAGQVARDAGCGFGWHNHDFEFQALDDGSMPLQRIFEGGPSLEWEADLAWIARGGADVLEWVERYSDRISAVHIKDIAPEGESLDEDGWADVGQGVLDWKAWLPSLQARSIRHFIMEHDNPSDHARFAKNAITYCQSI